MDDSFSTQINTEYILAIVPNEPVLGSLLHAKKDIGKYIIAQMDMLPHIKLLPKFQWDEREEYLLIHELKNLIPQINSFEVDILQIDKNKEENQVYLQTDCKVDFDHLVKTTCDQLCKLFPSMYNNLTEMDGRLILAEANFDPENFTLVAKRLSKKIYSGIFIADKISLFKNSGNGWHLTAELHLN